MYNDQVNDGYLKQFCEELSTKSIETDIYARHDIDMVVGLNRCHSALKCTFQEFASKWKPIFKKISCDGLILTRAD